MSCCGKTTQALASVAAGYSMFIVDDLFRLPGERSSQANIRLATCRLCGSATWLTLADYAAFLAKHKIEVVKNIADLSVLPPLNKKDYQPGAKLFCRICKCWLPAKAYVKNEKCPLNKWSTENG